MIKKSLKLTYQRNTFFIYQFIVIHDKHFDTIKYQIPVKSWTILIKSML